MVEVVRFAHSDQEPASWPLNWVLCVMSDPIPWAAVGAIGEILGAIGVIVTVAYLAIQIRHNTKALHLNSFQHDGEQMNRLSLSIVENPQFAGVVSKAFQNPQELADAEYVQFNSFLIANFHVFETLYYGYTNGTVPENLWKAEESGLKNMLAQPVVSDWWEKIIEIGPYTKEFREHVESIRKDVTLNQSWGDVLSQQSTPRDT